MVYHLRTVSGDSSGANTVVVAPVPNKKTKPNNVVFAKKFCGKVFSFRFNK